MCASCISNLLKIDEWRGLPRSNGQDGEKCAVLAESSSKLKRSGGFRKRRAMDACDSTAFGRQFANRCSWNRLMEGELIPAPPPHARLKAASQALASHARTAAGSRLHVYSRLSACFRDSIVGCICSCRRTQSGASGSGDVNA